MACTKIPYRTREAATRELRRQQRTMRATKLPIRVYYCRSHKAWHTTSKPLLRRSD